MEIELVIVFGVLLGLTHYFNASIAKLLTPIKKGVVSFSAGLSIAYLFLLLMPHLYSRAEILSNSLFLFILIGFSLFHVAEKYVYQHELPEEKLKWQLKEIHSVVFFAYNFVLGLLLVEITLIDLISGFLLFVALLSHAAISFFSFERIHYDLRNNPIIKSVLSISTLLGVAIALILQIPYLFSSSLLGFLAGALFFIIIREYLPPEREGSIYYFLIGAFIYTIIIAISWMI